MSEMIGPNDSVRIVGQWDPVRRCVRPLTDSEVVGYARRAGWLADFTRDRRGRRRSMAAVARRLRRLPVFGPPTGAHA